MFCSGPTVEPTNVTVSATSSSELSVTWVGVHDLSSSYKAFYRVFYKPADADGSSRPKFSDFPVAVTRGTIMADVNPDTLYRVQVAAVTVSEAGDVLIGPLSKPAIAATPPKGPQSSSLRGLFVLD